MEAEITTYLNKFDEKYLRSKGLGVFENVDYFSETYRGKMFITPRAIYYFPQVRTEFAEDDEKNGILSYFLKTIGLMVLAAIPIYYYFEGDSVSTALALASLLLVLPGIVITFGSALLKWRKKKGTVENQFMTIDDFHEELEEQIRKLRSGSSNFYGGSVPHPMGFPKNTISNLSIENASRFTKLRFRTKYDVHDFVFASQSRYMVRDSLIENGFYKYDEAQTLTNG